MRRWSRVELLVNAPHHRRWQPRRQVPEHGGDGARRLVGRYPSLARDQLNQFIHSEISVRKGCRDVTANSHPGGRLPDAMNDCEGHGSSD